MQDSPRGESIPTAPQPRQHAHPLKAASQLLVPSAALSSPRHLLFADCLSLLAWHGGRGACFQWRRQRLGRGLLRFPPACAENWPPRLLFSVEEGYGGHFLGSREKARSGGRVQPGHPGRVWRPPPQPLLSCQRTEADRNRLVHHGAGGFTPKKASPF